MVSTGNVPQSAMLSQCLTGGMFQEALDMEGCHGKEGVEGKYRKDKGHDLRYMPGPPAKFRQFFMPCLS